MKKSNPSSPSAPSDTKEKARALVLRPLLRHSSQDNAQAMLQEAVGLAQAIDLDVQDAQVITLANPHPGFLLRSGLVESFASFIKEMAVDLAIVDHPLTPVQQRNLERAWQCKVIDRTALILEIFGARARTKEGQLQVELAALTYQKSRLVRSWTHLERQRGGFGFLGGPGESQLELDRRMITDRIGKLKEDIAQVRRTRSLQRHARERAEYPTIALVGYTNAGKSTLFNRLTQAGVTAKDMLFVTLDPSMRKITLPSGQTAIIADTVGFIADLPTQLIEAFRATLEEVQLADFILHVRDITHPETRLQKQAVTQVLIELGIEPDDERLIEVMNKADLLDEEERARLRTYAQRQSLDNQQALDLEGIHAQPRGGAVALSSLSGEGVDDLLALLDKHLSARQQIYSLTLPLAQGAALAWLYGHGKVIEKKDFDTKIRLKVALKPADYGRFINKFGKS